MIEINDKCMCCGCSACKNICPKNAIEMCEDEYGFKYPMINKDLCINCGLCEKICPIKNNTNKKEKNIYAYACYNKNINDRLNSSSGGIFILLAKYIIKQNGVVFGATFDKEFNVIHSYVENEDELFKLMGSKYVQSDIGDSYKKAELFLKENRCVLFTGTPCQIEGLKKYLKKDYEKLITQDIICHGVPSPIVWREYLKFQKKKNYNNKIKNIFFRNKDRGWTSYRIKIIFENKVYSNDLEKDLYMQSFLKNLCLRDSCYNCKFKKMYRESDITLGDYWGINKFHKNMNDNKGTSLVIVNSEKGKKIFDAISSYIIFSKTDLTNALKYNSSMIESIKKPNNRDEFINEINYSNFDLIVKKYVPPKKIIKRMILKSRKIVKRILRR